MVFRRLFTVVLLAGFFFPGNSYAQSSNTQNIIYGIGVGYGGGLGGPGISYDLLPGYSGSVSPGFMATCEQTFNKSFGMGAVLSYSGASMSAINIDYPADPLTQRPAGTFNDKITARYIGLGARVAYHFKSRSHKVDTYIGAIGGFTFTSLSSTVSNTQGSYYTHSFFPGMLLGAYAGARIYFSDQFGMWIEAGYSGMPDYLANIGVAYKISRW